MNKKEISVGVILSFASQAINIITGFVFTPIIIRFLGQNEYGLYQLVQSVVNYLNLMTFGFNGAYIRYFSIARAKSDEEVANINGLFLKVYAVISSLSLLGGVILFANIHILGEQLTAADYVIAKRLLVLMVINLAISFPNSLFVSYMFANEHFVFYKILAIVINILLPALKIPVLLLGYGSVGIVVLTLAFTILGLCANALYCRLRLKMQINLRYFEKTVFLDLSKYTIFIFLSDLIDQLNSNVDKLLLGRIMGTVAVALYSVAYNLKTYFVTITWIVPEMYVPAVNRAVIEDKSSQIVNAMFLKIGRIHNFLTLLVISGFFLFGQVFVRLWVGEEYCESYYATCILFAASYIPAVQTLGVNIQNAKNMHQIRSIVYLLVACANVVFSVFLIRRWGVVGTCLGTFLAVIAGHGIFMNIYYHKKIGLDIIAFWKELSKWYPFVLVLYACAAFVWKRVAEYSWFYLVAGVLVYSLCYAGLMFAFGLNDEERSLLAQKVRRMLHHG